ncbi:hypothetical protein BpHYR1_031660 [Brachionus plicatilis]|uniref:Uncharacterized protein n=1 Tax=Brachionus plicatilis TaxID=10195 RepID=A0A3M7QGV8_BRAPC|nr:hypothetical protein BpHYR1_031660 [Brachionus plicatilis]
MEKILNALGRPHFVIQPNGTSDQDFHLLFKNCYFFYKIQNGFKKHFEKNDESKFIILFTEIKIKNEPKSVIKHVKKI